MDHNENWVIEAQDVSYTYEGNEEKALDGLELKIRRGSRVAFMGGNGSGKSTFFLCLNGIRKPDSGRICIDGKPIEYTRKRLLDVRGKVGIVFQEPDNQLFSASVYEEISFGILNLGADEETAREEVDQVIGELEIADILVMHPEVMILDEPAAALDPAHTRKVHQIVDRLTGKGITVLMATHDIDYAYRWADEIVLMHEGRVLRQGTPEAVCADRAALREAGLEPPSVLRLWECLQDKGMINRTDRHPRSTDELIRMLEHDGTDAQNKERI